MSFAVIEKSFLLYDIQFALEEINPNKKSSINNFTLKILNSSSLDECYNLKFYLYNNDKIVDNLQTKYIEFKSILFSKKSEIDLNKYKIIIKNYKPLFTIDIKGIKKGKEIKVEIDKIKAINEAI